MPHRLCELPISRSSFLAIARSEDRRLHRDQPPVALDSGLIDWLVHLILGKLILGLERLQRSHQESALLVPQINHEYIYLWGRVRLCRSNPPKFAVVGQ